MVGSVARIASTWWFCRAGISLLAGMGSQVIVRTLTLSLASTDQVARVSMPYGWDCLLLLSVGIACAEAVPMTLFSRSLGDTIAELGSVRTSTTLGPAS